MKKKIFFLLLILLSFSLETQAKTKEGKLLATCAYESDIVNFSIKIYDNGDLTYDPEAGPVGQINFGYNNLNKKNYFNAIYSNDQLSASCPSLLICNQDDYNYFVNSSTKCSSGNPLGPLKGTMTAESSGIDQKEDKSKTFCTRYTTSKTDDLQKVITFRLDSDGNKVFDLQDNVEKNAQGGTANYNQSVYIHDVQFFIDADSVDLFWSDDTCESTEVYAERYNGNAKVIILTAEQPDSWKDSSPDNSTGFEEDNSNSYNKEFNPKTLCEEADNCNIDLANFCTTGIVARSFKFLGLLFYIAKIFAPAIIIILGFINLFNIMMSGKIEDAKKYAKSIIIRIFVGIAIFLLPGIINTIYATAKSIIGSGGTGGFDNCVSCLLEPFSEECYIEEN